MEEDTSENVMEEEVSWADQSQGEVPVITDLGFIQTKDMATMIFVEEVMAGDNKGRCIHTQTTRSQDGQVQWRLCNSRDCHGCYFQETAAADLSTSATQGQTEKDI